MGMKRKGLWLRPDQVINKNQYKKNKVRLRQKRRDKTYQSSAAGEGDFLFRPDRFERFD